MQKQERFVPERSARMNLYPNLKRKKKQSTPIWAGRSPPYLGEVQSKGAFFLDDLPLGLRLLLKVKFFL